MSWIDKIQAPLSITTGDGKKYTLLWKNATRTREYNVPLFDYPEINGTMARRSTSKGRKYNFEFYFTGENCIETADEFDQSNENRTAWQMEHPLYGTLIVQPLSISYDNSVMNVTKVTGDIIETLTEENPRTFVNPIDNISLLKENLDQSVVATFDEQPTPADTKNLSGFNNKSYSLISKIKSSIEQANTAFNSYKKAQSVINTTSVAGSLIIGSLQATINSPILFTDNVKNRVKCLSDQFNSLRQTVGGIINRSSKKFYEANAMAVLSAQAQAAVNPNDGDYLNKIDVFTVLDQITDNYNNYLSDLNSLQTDNGGAPDSYIPNAGNLIALSDIVNNAINSLFITASQARQERTLYLEDNTDIINLTHRLYGLDPLDANIREMRKNNNMGISEVLEIRKGRKIVYYR